MDSASSRAAGAAGRIVRAFAGIALAVTLCAGAAHAQAHEPSDAARANVPPVRQTIFLAHVNTMQGLNDIQTDLRNMFPWMKIYGVPSQLAISIAGSQEEVAEAQKVIAELDRPVKTYRITYTITAMAGGNGGAQKYVVIATNGQRAELMEGTKVPIATAAPEKSGSPVQFQYVDTGLKITVTPQGSANALRLTSKIEQSSVTGEKPLAGVNNPTIAQTSLDATADLTEGKPQVLGSLDIPGTAKKLEISVVAEQVN